MYENMLTTYGKQFVFKCNINTNDTEKLKIKSRFLKNVLQYMYMHGLVLSLKKKLVILVKK